MIKLGGPDKVSIRLLEGWPNGLVFSPDIPTSPQQTADLIQEHFTNGSSAFIDGDHLTRYFVTRVRNYGHVESLQQARIREARSIGECHETWRQVTFSPVTTTKVRVLITEAQYIRSFIVELEAWGY